MKHVLNFGVLLFFIVLFAQCTSEKTNQKAEEIGLTSQNEELFQGQLEIDHTVISYAINATSELTFDTKVTINTNIINATINYEAESLDFDGHNTILSSQEKEILLKTGQAIASYLLDQKKGAISMAEYTLLSVIEYWGKSPPNYRYTKRSVNPKYKTLGLKSRNDGITCIKKKTTVTAQYDDTSGNHNDRVEVGSTARKGYECMGRCGAGCGRWWIPSAWTKDCLDHDQCSAINNSSGGSSDRNCGDEFDEAADDYIFGVMRGCLG